MKTNNNRIVLDLNKVQYGQHYYINQYGDCYSAHTSDKYPSVRGEIVKDGFAAYHPDYPGETMVERARRLELIDVWKSVTVFQLTANHNVTFTGKKAAQMWKMWCAKIMKRKKE